MSTNIKKYYESSDLPDGFDKENYYQGIISFGHVEKHGEAHYLLAVIYRQQERYGEAEDNLVKSIELGYDRKRCYDELDKLALTVQTII